MVETTEMTCSLDSGLLKLCLVHLSIGCFPGGPAVGTSSEPQEWTEDYSQLDPLLYDFWKYQGKNCMGTEF